MSEGSNEVYFEVGQYRNIQTQEAIKAFLEDVRGRFEQLEVVEQANVHFTAYPAVRLHIRWPGKERVILFIEREDGLFRIIRDPASQVNQTILDSFEFR
jgi:hypothetical protein